MAQIGRPVGALRINDALSEVAAISDSDTGAAEC